MKKLEKFFLLIMVLMLMLGAYGCMKSDDKTLEIMKAYVEEKYGEIYSVEYFVKAVDSTWRDVLTLSKDDDFIFNVYHSPEDTMYEEIFDDYEDEVIDEKIRRYLLEKTGQDELKMNVYVAWGYNKSFTLEEAQEYTVKQLLENIILFKLICVINVEQTKEESVVTEKELYEIYENLFTFNPEKVDFEVVYTKGKADDKLNSCIDNIREKYENDWESYPSVTGYIKVLGAELVEEDEFRAAYKEVN